MSEPGERQYVEGAPTEVQDLLYAGEKIAAIKLVREHTGLGLREAKEKVDRLSEEIEAEFPGALPRHRGGNPGCATALVLAAIVAIVGAFLYLRLA
ncbi:MAG: hypothetical protein HN742_14845 [Lentisphaerae bacterium]|jgi:hypothetical protein|nr:hypothetical protein [Lentisphaerota bacterium]MBT4818620.1 hypothetical protein [Lentisphaerota bacterium]MBT5609540.1 hypothetical protein [Lentisphaerota bacterium]MBT7058446.1 hypothetical protein [Lentisphaerota bacterium]MBT7843155.1 hypothetical protein [Lentisphaerota bacterium]